MWMGLEPILPAPIHDCQRHGFLKWKAGKKSLCVFRATSAGSINAADWAAVIQTLSSLAETQAESAARNGINIHPLSIITSPALKVTGGWTNPSRRGVKAGNNLDKSASHRKATQKDKQWFAAVLTVWEQDVHSFWNVEGGAEPTQKTRARNPTHNLPVGWKPLHRSAVWNQH